MDLTRSSTQDTTASPKKKRTKREWGKEILPHAMDDWAAFSEQTSVPLSTQNIRSLKDSPPVYHQWQTSSAPTPPVADFISQATEHPNLCPTPPLTGSSFPSKPYQRRLQRNQCLQTGKHTPIYQPIEHHTWEITMPRGEKIPHPCDSDEALVALEKMRSQQALKVLLRDHLSEVGVCPIRHEWMENPVIAADGFTYEKEAIEAWLARHGTSPMTREFISAHTLYPNRALAELLRKCSSLFDDSEI